jgi:F-type H+-transporting ATPase subunit delta
MQKVSRHRLATYIAKQLADGVSSEKLAKQMAAYLVENRMTKQVDLLLQDISGVLASDYGFVSAHVTSAHPLSSDLKAAIAEYIASTGQAKKVELTENTDKDLIGGVVVQTPTAILDSSIRTQLRHLRSIKETRSK